jgi:hypothetical protein
MPYVIPRTLGLVTCLLALACDEQPGTSTDRESLDAITRRATNAALEASAARADAHGAAAAATVAGAGAPNEDVSGADADVIGSDEIEPAPDELMDPAAPQRSELLAPTPYGTDSRAPGNPDQVNEVYAVPGDPINEMEAPRGNAIGEMEGERNVGSINEMETPRGNSISEIDAERARKDGADPISREPTQSR